MPTLILWGSWALGLFFVGAWTVLLLTRPHLRNPAANSIAASWWICLLGIRITNESPAHLLWLMPSVAMFTMIAFGAAVERALNEGWSRGRSIHFYTSGLSLTVSNILALALAFCLLTLTPRWLPVWLTTCIVCVVIIILVMTVSVMMTQVRTLTDSLRKPSDDGGD